MSEPVTLVTGAGGAAGVSVIRALVARGTPVVAVDASASATGLRLADDYAVVPRSDEPHFAERLCAVAQRTGAEALVSTVAEEVGALWAGRSDLEAAGLRTWLPNAEAVAVCLDKWRFAALVDRAGIPAPSTALAEVDGVPGPWIVKPRFGRGSREVYAVAARQEVAWAIDRVTQPIVQHQVDGREFTVDCLVDRDGTLAGAVPRWRLETKAGISTKGETFADDAVVSGAERLLRALRLEGPANVQGFVRRDGSVAFVEVNPRFSGGLPLSLAAGADLVGEYVRAVMGEPIRRERLSYRTGVTMMRYFEEVFEG